MCRVDVSRPQLRLDKDSFLQKFHDAKQAIPNEPADVAEIETNALNTDAAQIGYKMWAHVPQSLEDVKARAELAAHWTSGSLDEDGNLHLPDLTSEHMDKRAANRKSAPRVASRAMLGRAAEYPTIASYLCLPEPRAIFAFQPPEHPQNLQVPVIRTGRRALHEPPSARQFLLAAEAVTLSWLQSGYEPV